MGKFNGRRRSVPYMSELSLKTVRVEGCEMRCRWGEGAKGDGGGAHSSASRAREALGRFL